MSEPSESNAFITANDQPISIERALRYLKSTGKLEFVLWEIVLQHVIEQELNAVEELEINSELIDQIILEFRVENDLTNYDGFQAWLANDGLDYSTFRQQIASKFQLEHLKTRITERNLQEYFIEQKIFLDRVVLSRLVVQEKALAEELKSQILEEGARFEHLAQEYSVAEDGIFNGMMGAASRGTMPDDLRAAIDLANPGELIGPLKIEELWYLVRVEKFLPASLDESIEQQLKDELFEQWLEEKVQQMDVQLHVKF
jgi:parvulin-like peptidyl-prolyl isomerase